MGRKPLTDWSKIDWSKSNTELRAELHASLQVIARNRAIYTEVVPVTRPDWSKVDLFNDSTALICKKLGVTKRQVYTRRARFNQLDKDHDSKFRQADWSKADFTQPVATIARAVGVSRQAVYNYMERNQIASTTKRT